MGKRCLARRRRARLPLHPLFAGQTSIQLHPCSRQRFRRPTTCGRPAHTEVLADPWTEEGLRRSYPGGTRVVVSQNLGADGAAPSMQSRIGADSIRDRKRLGNCPVASNFLVAAPSEPPWRLGNRSFQSLPFVP